MVPSWWSAQEWLLPVVMAVASEMKLTWTGGEEMLVVPLPSRPKPLLPQQDMVPSSWSAQE